MAGQAGQSAEWLERVYPRNRAGVLGVMAFFLAGLVLIDPSTILAGFVVNLTSSPLLLGLVLVVYNAGAAVPQIFFAGLLQPVRRKKRAWMLICVGLTVPFLALAPANLALAGQPAALLLVFFVALGAFSLLSGLETLVWWDLMGRILPPARRGSLLGLSRVLGGVMAIGAGLAARQILETVPAPTSYSVLFALFVVVMLLAAAPFALVEEPVADEIARRLSLRESVIQAQALARRDLAFRRLLLTRLLHLSYYLALPFYVSYGHDVLGLATATTGLYATMAVAGQVVGSSILALVSGKFGNRPVVLITVAVAAVLPATALLLSLGGASLYALLYLLVGAIMAGERLGFVNYLLDLAPAKERLTYISLLNSASLPVLLAPALGGLLLQAFSYWGLFAVATLLLLPALALAGSLPNLRAGIRPEERLAAVRQP